MDSLNHRESEGMDKNHCQTTHEALEHLHKAEQDLEKALEKEREAEREVAKAEAEVKEATREIEHARHFTVEIIYDGVKKKFEVRIEETVKHLLDQAIRAFGPLPNPHTLSLYRDGKAKFQFSLANALTVPTREPPATSRER
jgi:hypothetical protein